MNLLRCILFLQLTTTVALGQVAVQSKPVSLPNDPESFVRSFYQQVVARQPVGIPYGDNMKIFAPYLSKTLLHKIDLAIDCSRDWSKQHPGHRFKPPFAWFEAGLFSGPNERTDPNAFVIERTESMKDGSIRVYLKLTGGEPPDIPWIWQVAAVLVWENGHLFVDNVIYLKDSVILNELRLSEVLARQCDGPRWVGAGGPRLQREK